MTQEGIRYTPLNYKIGFSILKKPYTQRIIVLNQDSLLISVKNVDYAVRGFFIHMHI